MANHVATEVSFAHVSVADLAFYAKVWSPKTEFTLSPGEVSEWKALIQKGIDYELTRIEKGGLPKALTLEYLRRISGDGKQEN